MFFKVEPIVCGDGSGGGGGGEPAAAETSIPEGRSSRQATWQAAPPLAMQALNVLN